MGTPRATALARLAALVLAAAGAPSVAAPPVVRVTPGGGTEQDGDRAVVRRVLSRARVRLRACGPSPAGAPPIARFRVDPEGQARDVTVGEMATDRERCLAAVVGGLTFPRRPAMLVVTTPLMIAP
jgi:hypothetical protein